MKHRICMLNIARINYDHRLDISCIKGDVVAYEDSDLQEILQRVQDCEIVVSKELGLSKALIEQFPDLSLIHISQGLCVTQSDDEFEALLKSSIQSIYDASIT